MMETSPTTSPDTAPAGSGTNRGRWLKPYEASACATVYIAETHVILESTATAGGLVFDHAEWADFLRAVKAGHFDL